MGNKSLARKTVINIIWSYASFFSAKIINLGTVVLLSWLLDPAEFGLMAIALAFLAYFELIAQFGLGSALISERYDTDTSKAAVAVFASLFVLSMSIAFLISLSAPSIANLYGEPALKSMLMVLSLILPVRAVSIVSSSYLSRELKFRAKLIPDLAAALIRGAVSIGLAFSDFGVWALVWGHLAGAGVSSIAAVLIRPWWPREIPQFITSWRMLKFGANLIGAQAINMTPRLLDSLLIGKVLGPETLGVYMLASRLPDVAIRNNHLVVASVFHPIMSSLQGDLSELQSYYYSCLRYYAAFVFGGAAALVVLADPLTHILFHDKWHGMVRPMQYLSVAFAISSLSHLPGVVYKAISRTDLLFKVALINTPILIGGLWISLPYGIEAVAFAKIVVALLRMIPNQLFLRRTIEIQLGKSLAAIVPGLICASAVVLVGLGIQSVAIASDTGRLAAASLLCAAAYLAALRLVSPEVFAVASRAVLKRLRPS